MVIYKYYFEWFLKQQVNWWQILRSKTNLYFAEA